MQTVQKRFKTIKQAESYQNRLYNKYPYVKLFICPMWGEEGLYIWEVSM